MRIRSALLIAASLALAGAALAAAPFGYELRKTIGETGRGRHELKKPAAVAVSKEGWLAVADAKREAVVIFDDDGNWVATAGGEKGPGRELFDSPSSLCFDRRGRIWVADAETNRLVVLDTSGNVVMTVGRRGTSEGEFRKPSSVASSSTGRIYVADPGNRRIQLLANRGPALDEWKPGDFSLRGKLGTPVDLTYTDSGEGSILVRGEGSSRVERFDLDGNWLQTVDAELAAGRKVKLADIGSDGRFGWIFLLDEAANSVLVLNGRGELDQEIQATEGAVFSSIAVTDHRDIYVADSKNARVLYFERK